MIVGEIIASDLKLQFIPLDKKEFKVEELNIEAYESKEDLIETINGLETNPNCFYEVVLTGKRKIEINIYDLYKLLTNEAILKIKDESTIYVNLKEIANEQNLKGIFVKTLLEKLEKEQDEKEKEMIQKAIEVGLSVM